MSGTCGVACSAEMAGGGRCDEFCAASTQPGELDITAARVAGRAMDFDEAISWGLPRNPEERALLTRGRLTVTPVSRPGLTEREVAYLEGRWCGECRYGLVEDPNCCTPGCGKRSTVPVGTCQRSIGHSGDCATGWVWDRRKALSTVEEPSTPPRGTSGVSSSLDGRK